MLKPYCYIHITRTGGSSIAKALVDQSKTKGYGHKSALQLRELYPDYDERFSFTIVRNPWDRLVSKYARHMDLGCAWTRGMSFNHWATHYYEIERKQFGDSRPWRTKDQVWWITDEDGAVIVDYIGRFEDLQASWEHAITRIGGEPVELPRIRPSKHGHYTDYYDKQLAEIVGERYRRDIEHFGYRFGE